VNAERQSNLQKEREKASVQAKLREQELRDSRRFPLEPQNNGNGLNGDAAGNSSKEVSAADPTDRQRVAEKSKFEASEVWKSKKGDRFS
jgi:hypothetical protein